MPDLLLYSNGRYIAPGRADETRLMFGVVGVPTVVHTHDPLVAEQAQHEARMAKHWIRYDQTTTGE